LLRTRLISGALAALVGGGVVAPASAQSQANGLPPYTDGYSKWRKLNRKPITAPGAHDGVKNVYASRRMVGTRYPNGAVVVKTIRNGGFVNQFAAMRKVKGRWQFVEWERSGPKTRFRVLTQGKLCLSCHMQARANDFVFTRG
jgi:Cytochrome P460